MVIYFRELGSTTKILKQLRASEVLEDFRDKGDGGKHFRGLVEKNHFIFTEHLLRLPW